MVSLLVVSDLWSQSDVDTNRIVQFSGVVTAEEDGDILERNSEENVMLKKLDLNTLAPD